MQPADAETLQRLTITRLVLSLDRTTIMLGSVVHLTIQAHIREKIDRLDNVVLPNLATLQSEGDERRLEHSSLGSDYTELLTLRPQMVGRYIIGPVTIDAVYRVTGKPSRFSSNSVALTVITPTQPTPWQLIVLRLLVVLAAAGVGAYFTFRIGVAFITRLMDWLAGRKNVVLEKPIAEDTPPPSAPVQHIPDSVDRLRNAIRAARANPDKMRALELRLALRALFGAHSDETLSDLLVRVAGGDRGLYARALRAAERAFFMEDEGRITALEDSLPVIEAALSRYENER